MTETKKVCECCKTNTKKAPYAKYCDTCSEYICNVILLRTHRIDTRYKKVFQSLHQKIQRLAQEDPFIPKQMKELIEGEE